MRSWLTTAILTVFLSAFSPWVLAEDCEQSQYYFLHGVTKGKFQKWTEAKELLIKSVSMCNRFNNWYLLGKVYFELGQFEDATSAFEDARYNATDDDERALAIARYAEVQASQGMINLPLGLLREANKMHSSAPQWIPDLIRKLDNKRVSEPLSIAQVTNALSNKSIKLLHLQSKPSLNVSIKFQFDSTKVIKSSKPNIDVLAKALMADPLRKKSVTIIGHTDARGSGSYNQELSKQRAETIASMLYKRYPGLKGRIKIEGKGEVQPLYQGNTDWEYQMNRRIEIQLAE
ncbi:MAG: OmpA family protein [Thiohalomonadales bacterium]